MGSSNRKRVVDFDVPAERHVIQDIRGKFEDFISPAKLPKDEVEWIKVAVSEACTNAVCHGSPHGAQDHVRIHWEMDAETLFIEVTDQGGGFKPAVIELPDDDEWKPSGRGLVIMSAIMDDVAFEPIEGGTCVRMVKHLRPLAAQQTAEPEPVKGTAHAGAFCPA